MSHKFARSVAPRIANNTGMTKYCAFHDGQGHTTNDCINLWDTIEGLIRIRKLGYNIRQTATRKTEEAKFFGTANLHAQEEGVKEGTKYSNHCEAKVRARRIKRETQK